MTLTEAKAYVAWIVGGSQSTDLLAQAAYAIKTAANVWSRHRWTFLRKTVDIPVYANNAILGLPADFAHPYSARLITLQQPLRYIQQRLWDRCVGNQSLTGWPWFYTVNKIEGWSTDDTTLNIVLLRTPDTDDTLRLRYYRSIDGDAATIDMHPDYLMDFLDTARVFLLQSKNAADERLPILKADIVQRVQAAKNADFIESEDEELGFQAPGWGLGEGYGSPIDTSFFPGGWPA